MPALIFFLVVFNVACFYVAEKMAEEQQEIGRNECQQEIEREQRDD